MAESINVAMRSMGSRCLSPIGSCSTICYSIPALFIFSSDRDSSSSMQQDTQKLRCSSPIESNILCVHLLVRHHEQEFK